MTHDLFRQKVSKSSRIVEMMQLERIIPALSFPTLGGRQFWTDVAINEGIRFQRNHWTGHHRTLDDRDWRVNAGTGKSHLTSIGSSAAQSGVSTDVGPPSATLVILLHGLFRSRHATSRMENHLKSLGWNTIAIGYPSALIRIQSHADDLNRFLDRTQGFDNVIFVTHSMGGLVARAALARLAPWRQRIKVEGLIQLGTPNQGAGLARALRAFPVVGSLLGRTAVRSETRQIHRNHHQKFRFW